MVASECFGCSLECWGYTLGVTNIIKCVVIIGISSYLIETAGQKAAEYQKHSDSTLNHILREILIYSGLTLGSAILELIILLVLICGINMAIPCMVFPWIVMAMVTFVIAFVRFIRIMVQSEPIETVVLVSNILSMIYLSPRDFLSGLAFRVFHCTQYIRHSSDPFYTPEPDCCHELLGHMPLLANPSFAQFSQEIGLASLGASDEDIEKLATLYFFTVEFGLCKQKDGSFKVYGAGLLSSVAELQHALAASNKIKKFDPDVTCREECIITAYQNAYYYTDSFEEAKEQMRAFADNIQRPFGVRYNPYTQSVDVLSNAKKITAVVSELRGDLSLVCSALKKVSAMDQNLDVEGIVNLLQTSVQVTGEKNPISPSSPENSDISDCSQKQ